MELQFTDEQLSDIVDVIIGYWCRVEIGKCLQDDEYLCGRGIEDLSAEEFEEAVRLMHDKMYDCIIGSDWSYEAMNAINKIVTSRPKPEPKEPPKDYLNDTLKQIGLETNEVFFINDQEFSDQALRIDSFGDVFWVGDSNAHPREWPIFGEEHDYLTLGRILTQYPDKIVPLT